MPRDNTNLGRTNILLGVTGGISAYKAVALASSLTQAGAAVRTVMTANACRLVGPKSFEAVTGAPVFTDLWSGPEEFRVTHINLADWADIVVVVPATANIIGKMANGIADELLSTVLCACWSRPTILAPAMNTNMWNNPAVRQNVEKLKDRGVQLVGPEEGPLACGATGLGRMSEPQKIFDAIVKAASQLDRQT